MMKFREIVGKADEFLSDQHVEAVFLIGSLATLGSLFTSNVLNWSVCELCWFQRAFMYPIPFIAGAAIHLERKELVAAVIPLSAIGMLSSTYQYVSTSADPMSICGAVIPCSTPQSLYIGFFLRTQTLPVLAFLAFTAITFLLWRYSIGS